MTEKKSSCQENQDNSFFKGPIDHYTACEPYRFLAAKETWESLRPFERNCCYLYFIESWEKESIAYFLKSDRSCVRRHIESGERKIINAMGSVGIFLRTLERNMDQIELTDFKFDRRLPENDSAIQSEELDI